MNFIVRFYSRGQATRVKDEKIKTVGGDLHEE
jgi:hypothetical protein